MITIPPLLAVYNTSKIQIWKRITTGKRMTAMDWQLYLIRQRYKFESESQLNMRKGYSYKGCI